MRTRRGEKRKKKVCSRWGKHEKSAPPGGEMRKKKTKTQKKRFRRLGLNGKEKTHSNILEGKKEGSTKPFIFKKRQQQSEDEEVKKPLVRQRGMAC